MDLASTRASSRRPGLERLAPLYSTFKLHGESPWSAQRIIQETAAGVRVSDLPGDFTAIATGTLDGRPQAKIVSSMVAARPYFACQTRDGRFVHGASVFDVVRAAGLPWRWNRRAINCLALFGHTIGEDTLHPNVRRLPYAATVTADGTSVRTVSHDHEWSELFAPRSPTTMEEAISTLARVFEESAVTNAVVSLSAGFDSRLLLALALRRGDRPIALTMGHEASTDVIVARQIASALGLEHRVVRLEARDYLTHARAIVAATSGTKTAANWHTDLYVRRAGLASNTVHFVGSNGEFARTFFFDLGGVARAAAKGASVFIEPYVAARLARRAGRFPAPLLAGGPGPRGCALDATRASRALTKGFLEALDCFYATERVRHFIGNGLALYAQHCAPRSPFLDARWMRAVAALPRRDRLGSNYHRQAVATLWPRLLDFPMGLEPSLAPRAPALYYARRANVVGYSPFAEVAADPKTRELIVEASGLDELLSRRDRAAAVERYPASVELLLTLAIASELGREASARPDA